MSVIILELAALLLSLFCLIFSCITRREQYFPLPKGLRCACQNRHSVFLALLVLLIASSAVSVAADVAGMTQSSAQVLLIFRSLYHLLHNVGPLLLCLYVLDLCGGIEGKNRWFCPLLVLPLLLSELLVLTNPLTRLCFSAADSPLRHSVSGILLLHGVDAFYLAACFCLLLSRGRRLSHSEHGALLLLLLTALVGMTVQAIWSVPVELFFESVALFVLMSILEQDEEGQKPGANDHLRNSSILAVTFIFFIVIVLNAALILNMNRSQSDRIGNTQLEVIRSELEDTIEEAETNLLRVAIGAEQLMDSNASREELARYFDTQCASFLVHREFMNVYIGGPDWHVVPGFDAPADFHASERVWYLGAIEHPGEVFISDPYKDANTGSMCFTVSTLLSDGESVVGMDLNFSNAQEAIEQMTGGGDQTAMIVTSAGIIAGATDMSLVGQRAEEKMPEYADVLQRVISSRTHGSFRMTLDGQPCMIFSSQTENNWYLILCVGTDVLYAESYQQIAALAAVNLLMLVVVVVYFLATTRTRRRAERALCEQESFLGDLANQLRQSAVRILRLSDCRFLEENSGPEELGEQMQGSGEELMDLSHSIRAYAHLLRSTREEALRCRSRQQDSSSAPSRNARNGVILTLVFSLIVVLTFCVSFTTELGATRLNREADRYETRLNEWIVQQTSILDLFTDVISARPELMDDYDSAVELLDDIAQHYPDISACYMANPYRDPPVIMNTGWIPGEDYRPETRPWYRDTERSSNGFNISVPYLDAQTGNYCITFSRVVYGRQGQFLGIFGIDFFLDPLIHVLGESYTSRSYAFLVDSEGVIINHPNEAYQMAAERSIKVSDTEYDEAARREGISILRDYSGSLVSCLSRRTGTGFTVLVANRWWSIFGSTVFIVLTFLVLFGFCIAIIVLLLNRLIRWQGEVTRQLTEAAEAAVNAGKAKSQFLAQMSHEIRTPMNAIIGLNNIALRDESLSPRTREDLEKIGASARHLLSLINDILDMSRIESGRMVLKEDEFSFREFLEQINVIISGQCRDKGLRYQCTSVDLSDDCFVGDDLKLKQVLINILGNAVKFTNAPGTVSFKTEQHEGENGLCTLTFTIADTGVGMDAEYIPRLFEAFSQEDYTSTNCYGGSGLGMAITKNMVDMMGGTIQVESEKGVGSTFTVTVPLKRGTAQTPPVPAAQEPEAVPHGGWHVLIAEDNALNAEILMDLLDMEDITCEWAENGKLAVDLFADSEPGHFQAVLMDMRMPVMDGLAATRALRALDHPQAKSIPVVALTANAFEEDVQKCLEAGMTAHLSKPVDIDLLLETLRRLLAAR